MASTPNFNWSTPDNTGLVKNGALDIRTLGNSIDASMADLKGGTTGQVLAKATNTDMDFAWVAQDDSNAIQNAIVDAKGDLIGATAADTPARLAVGTNGQVLTADSTAATGLAWSTVSVAESLGYAAGKNVVINGAMTISQRGTTFTPTTNLTYTLDRWLTQLTAASKFSVAQSTTSAPNTNGYFSLITSLSAYSVAAGDTFAYSTRIEGYNFRQFAFGTSDAKTITLSFLVKSSLTGTFSGSLTNSAEDRSYPFTYTISTANTWEQKSVTIAGDTTGTWLYQDNVGAKLFFNLGAGATYSGTAGAWTGSGKYAVTGSVSVVGTNAATWQITNVQIEAGSVATAFQTATGNISGELAACQRYLPAITTTSVGEIGTGFNVSTTQPFITIPFQVPARVAPTGITATAANYQARNASGSGITLTAIAFNNASTTACAVLGTVASGLVQGNGTSLQLNGTILFTGCEL